VRDERDGRRRDGPARLVAGMRRVEGGRQMIGSYLERLATM
jgi:hypothetical protein